MKRREFIAVLASTTVAWPLGARAQRSDKVFRVGSVYVAEPAIFGRLEQAFISALHELGYVAGQNIAEPEHPGQNLAASLIFEGLARPAGLYRLLFSGEIGIGVELLIHILRSKLRY